MVGEGLFGVDVVQEPLEGLASEALPKLHPFSEIPQVHFDQILVGFEEKVGIVVQPHLHPLLCS